MACLGTIGRLDGVSVTAAPIDAADLSQLIDIERYPLDGRELSASDARHAGYWSVVERARGGREGVHTLNLQPGDLQIFRGRYSLHRVTRVAASSQPRHAAIFA